MRKVTFGRKDTKQGEKERRRREGKKERVNKGERERRREGARREGEN